MNKNDPFFLFDTPVEPGTVAELSFHVARLHSRNVVSVPVIVAHAKKPGPVVLFTAGIHGDEVNGVEIVRQLIAKKINIPTCGTTICIPVINIFGFISMDRNLPDGRDLNRAFPGSKTGSLAARIAHKLVTEILPHVNYIIDFHTGGANRFNAPQIRIIKDTPQLAKLAVVFGTPFVLISKQIKQSFRNIAQKKGVPMLLFEGGKSFYIDPKVTQAGVQGCKRILHHLGMLSSKFSVQTPKTETIFITQSNWLRAKHSGMFKPSEKLGAFVNKKEVLGYITDPYGKFNYVVKAANAGFIININQAPLVYQGDALFHMSSIFKPTE